MVAKLKCKGINGPATPGVEPAPYFDSKRETPPKPEHSDDRQIESSCSILWLVVSGSGWYKIRNISINNSHRS